MKNTLYNTQDASKYKQLTQSRKKNCKSFINKLLSINQLKRSPEAVGQWFSKPDQIPSFEHLSRNTILYFMKLSLTVSLQQQQLEKEHQKSSNYFQNLLNL